MAHQLPEEKSFEQFLKLVDSLSDHERTQLRYKLEKRAVNREIDNSKQNAILDMVAGLRAEVPAKEWDRLPKDLARNIDNYLYGAKRK